MNYERITAWVADKKALFKLAKKKGQTVSSLIREALKAKYGI